MNSAFFLVLRRMRVPIIVLIVIYAISVFGLTLVPGIDADGKAAEPSPDATCEFELLAPVPTDGKPIERMTLRAVSPLADFSYDYQDLLFVPEP